MSSGKIAILGAIAGFTIFIGLPVGRLQRLAPRLRVLLNAIAIGILIFLLWDVLSKGMEPLEAALTAATDGGGTWARFTWLAIVFTVCLGVGLLSLVYYEGSTLKKATPSLEAASIDAIPADVGITEARRLALFIAIGIGLHNFSEGLAIGQSAAKGEISLALVLIIGFGLHNATEGFGIIAPMASEGVRPSWAFLGMMGLIGGGPTLLGTLIGQSFVNDVVFMGFLALAAGSILYVVVQLLMVAARHGHRELLMWGILIGLVAGFATDMVLTAAGA